MSLQNDLDGAKIRHEGNVEAINQQHNALIGNAEQDYQAAELAYNATRISVGQRDQSYARWWFYWPFLIGLATLEVPVNQLAFQLYFGEGSLLSTFITFGVGVVLIYFAHGVGINMRRFRHNSQTDGGAIASTIWIVSLTTISLIISYSLAILRQGYLAFQRQPDPSLTELIEQGRKLEAAATVVSQAFLRFALEIDGWIFFFINVGILTVGVLASFWSHDPHPDYAAQHKKMQRTLKKLQTLKANRGRDLGTEEANYAARQAQVRRKYTED